MIVPDQSNIKVHFAATENVNQFNVIKALGYHYSLYTAYPFLERVIYKKPSHPIIPCQYKDNIWGIPQFIIKNSRHTIQDSGLFTLMFGSKAGNKDKNFLDSYCDALIDFTNQFGTGATVVEMDTQKVLGPESAWGYRQRLSSSLKNRILNVFHIEDGQKGLDRLIEYSNYLAISVPELRKTGKKEHLIRVANYIKNKKPSIDIHLLGFTEKKLLPHVLFCSSCDSSSYTSGVRYGYIDGKSVNNIDVNKAKTLISNEDYQLVTSFISESRACSLIINTKFEIDKYKRYAGNQN